jgi:hypothetical protein
MPVLGSAKPPVQFVPVAISPGVKRPRPEADHSLLCSTELNNGGDMESSFKYIEQPAVESYPSATGVGWSSATPQYKELSCTQGTMGIIL